LTNITGCNLLNIETAFWAAYYSKVLVKKSK